MKNVTIRKTVATAVSVAVLTSFAGCSQNTEDTTAASVLGASQDSEAATSADAASENTVLTVGASITPHSEILEFVAPILAEQGITLEIVQIEDSITPNTGVIDGSLDANYFQHVPYLEQFNLEN